MENFSFPKDLIAIHKLIKYVEYLVLCEVVFFLFSQVFEGSIRAVFHEDIVVVIWKTFKGFNAHKVRMNWKLLEHKNFLFYFFLLPVIFVGNNFGNKLLIGLVVSDGLFNDSESPFPHNLIIEDNKLQLLLVELFCYHKFCFFLHI